MGEAARAAYEQGAGGGAGCGVRAAVGGRADARMTPEEFGLRLFPVQQRRRNAYARYLAHENLDSGWNSAISGKLQREYLEACGEECRLMDAFFGPAYDHAAAKRIAQEAELAVEKRDLGVVLDQVLCELAAAVRSAKGAV